ncbi:hypothetical protein F5Y10DRAFT_280638 [Nemania abortiva]|nr:hypothetical protein F5Y10DRAFT_280638 [Nemania abortiva]
MVDLHSLPKGTRPSNAIRNNGPDHLVIERLKLRELAEGWPCYRDACEWENLDSIFHPGAYVYTTWTGRTLSTDFREASKADIDKGTFIMHRCHEVTSDITPDTKRAVTKMKATITQRFIIDDCEVDVDADCRFIFCFDKKDKLIPTNPNKIPKLNDTKLESYPPDYKNLAYCQELTMGVSVLKDLPGHRRHAGTVNGEKHDLLYRQAKDWLDGNEVSI